jgi:peptide/nickel transport system permease protein
VTAFVLRRIVQGVVIVFLVASLTFVLLHLAPGEPFSLIGDSAGFAPPRSVVEANKAKFGLDKPLATQYVIYIKNLLTGYFGQSYTFARPVLPILLDYMGRTIVLGLATLIVNFGVGVAVGTFQALRYPSRMDSITSTITLVVYSLPVFWFGLVLVVVFVEGLGLFPALGTSDPVLSPTLGTFGMIVDRLHRLVLPAATLGLIGAAATARFHRSAMLDVIRLDHTRTARAKGLSERRVALMHVFRNALLPVISLFGLTLPILLSGSVFVERVFAWQGLGFLTVDAINRRDYQLVTGSAILVAALVVVANLIADVLYRVADPRARTTI